MESDDLTQALFRNYQRAGKEAKYWGFYFLRDLKKYGGLKVAQRLLAKTTKAGETKGFLALADVGRPDLSVEAVVLDARFRSLFSEQEIAIAEQRLARFPEASWRKRLKGTSVYPDELPEGRVYREGAVARVQVNRYERDSRAREACLARHGRRCKVCDLKFAERYGEIGEDFIHVHHLKPLATMREGYQINPESDLVPVCPNCHCMLHTSDPPLSIDELKERLGSGDKRSKQEQKS
jgi:5-methylcytosine-specific restriction protein A